MSQSPERTYLVITKAGRFQIKGNKFEWKDKEPLCIYQGEGLRLIAKFATSELVGVMDMAVLVDTDEGEIDEAITEFAKAYDRDDDDE